MITGMVIGRSEIRRKLLAMGPLTKTRLITVVKRLALQLQRNIKKDKLTGQVLKVRTGTLRRSIYQKVIVDSTQVTGIVGTNVRYAAAHEFGFDGSVNVKAHLRNIKQAWGRPLQNGPMEVSVGAHTRKMKMPERSFLRSALKDMEPEIVRELQSVVVRGLRGLR